MKRLLSLLLVCAMAFSVISVGFTGVIAQTQEEILMNENLDIGNLVDGQSSDTGINEDSIAEFSTSATVANTSSEGESFVVDGIKDSAYTDQKSLDHSYWKFYESGSQDCYPLVPERVENTLWFNWDDDFVYLYFEAKDNYSDLYKPAEGEAMPDRDVTWFEQVNVYLDTAPSLAYNASCIQGGTDENGDPLVCNHFCCNANQGDGKSYRLMCRNTPAWNRWHNYYRSDEGMFMTYDEFVAWRCDPNSIAYDSSYVDDPMGWYLKENGAAQAASFIDYDTNTYGFEMKYPRAQGEEYFQLNVVNDANSYDWPEEGPEIGYYQAFCNGWWQNSEDMLEIWYEDYPEDSEEPNAPETPDTPNADNSFVIDGIKDSAYTDLKSLDHSYWNFYDNNGGTYYDPVDLERVKNTVWFNWDDDSVYLYFQCESQDDLFKPAADQTGVLDFDVYFYEIAQVYLDTAPSLDWDAPCIWAGQDGNSDTCAHIICNSRGGDGCRYRLMARANPAWGEWNDYFATASGMFMTYEEFCENYQGREGYEDLAAKYAEAHGNGEGQAATFIDYDTNTYGFEMKFPRAQGEDHFQLNIRTRVNEKEWEEWGPEPAYSLSFCPAWWLNSDEMIEIYYEDFPDDMESVEPNTPTDIPETEGVFGDFGYTLVNEQATIVNYNGNGGEVEIPATINGTPVVAIGEKAFAGQTALTSVVLPSTLKTIGNRAFFGCTALTALNIPQGVQTIEEYAFCGCVSLKTVSISDTVTTLGEGVFAACDGLEAFTVSAENANYAAVDGVLFNKGKTLLIHYPAAKTNTSYTVPNTVTTIGEEAFYGAENLTKITLPATLRAIEGYAFYDCFNLRNITLPAGLTSLGDAVFFNCTQLVSVTLPAGITTLPYATFGGCSGLTTVNLSYGVTAIEEYAFFSCQNLSSVTLPATVTQIADSAFKDCGSSLVVWGENGSYAQTFAQNNNIIFNVTDEDMPLFSLENLTVRDGETFTAAVKVKNNPGIVSAKLKLNFDANLLEAVSFTPGDFAGVAFSPITNNPLVINWVDSLYENNTTDGVLAYVTFKVKENAPAGNTVLSLFYDGEDVFDFDYNNVTFGVQNGVVTVVDYISGDLNDDGEIDNKDLSEMMRYLNAWGNEINEGAADVNRDGSINNKDYSVLQRYLNGWNITLK